MLSTLLSKEFSAVCFVVTSPEFQSVCNGSLTPTRFNILDGIFLDISEL
jgi:hypothetical protein